MMRTIHHLCGGRWMRGALLMAMCMALLTKESSAFSAPNNSLLQQIKRAKRQLASFRPTQKDENLLDDINDALNNGRVKPFFHTLFLPEIFLNNHRSCSVVTAGKGDKRRKVDLGLLGENLNDAVGKSDNGARSLTDKGLGEIWDFSDVQTAFAVELVNADAEMLGEDIECTKLNSFPIKISPGEESYDLLTRPESRGVVCDIFHRFAKAPKQGSVAAITGSPGIGKSWTLFYALQQALHYEGATVLFFFQKAGFAVMYLRRDDKIFAWAASISTIARSSLFMRPEVLVLLDPEEARKGGADFKLGDMKLLYAASNNEAHFKGAAEKEFGQIQTYLGPPLDTELPVIIRRLSPSLEPDVIQMRKEVVGNLIRYILDGEKFKLRQLASTTAVEKCAGDPKVLERAVEAEGMSDGEQTIPGTLFQVLPKRPDHPATMGYEGQEVDYRERVVVVANNNVRDEIFKANRKVILSYWGRSSGDEYATMGREAEKLFIKDLQNPDGMVMKRYLQGKK